MSLRGYKKKSRPAPWIQVFPGQPKPVPITRRVGKSKAKAKLDREWARLAKAFWADRENQKCCVPSCQRAAEDPHHTRGRTRKLQNDLRWIVPVCRHHHDLVKSDPSWAKAVVVYPGTPREQPLLAGGGDWNRWEPDHDKFGVALSIPSAVVAMLAKHLAAEGSP